MTTRTTPNIRPLRPIRIGVQVAPQHASYGELRDAAAELEQLGVKRVTFGSGLMRATLRLIRQMAQELHTNGTCDSLVQTEFSHATVNQLFIK